MILLKNSLYRPIQVLVIYPMSTLLPFPVQSLMHLTEDLKGAFMILTTSLD